VLGTTLAASELDAVANIPVVADVVGTLAAATLSSSASTPGVVEASLNATLAASTLAATADADPLSPHPVRMRLHGRSALGFAFVGRSALAFKLTGRSALRFTFRSNMTTNAGDHFPIDVDLRSAISNELTDPEALAFFVKHKESGQEWTFTRGVDAEVTRVSLGLFRLMFYIPKIGTYQVVAVVTGAVAGRDQWGFFAESTVADTAFPP
jgi:hypothetical protein